LFKPEENYSRDRVSLTIIKQYFAEYEIAQEFIRRMELFFARPISLFVQSGFCSAPDREFYAL
jgi:hypothetical protein